MAHALCLGLLLFCSFWALSVHFADAAAAYRLASPLSGSDPSGCGLREYGHSCSYTPQANGPATIFAGSDKGGGNKIVTNPGKIRAASNEVNLVRLAAVLAVRDTEVLYSVNLGEMLMMTATESTLEQFSLDLVTVELLPEQMMQNMAEMHTAYLNLSKLQVKRTILIETTVPQMKSVLLQPTLSLPTMELLPS
ncbi:hypothetical protein GJAV_G00246750 [Gymnothorax javanicus]|nr:hypothetical protein GJAV_G00246750 [Gymnothorax javanicus]